MTTQAFLIFTPAQAEQVLIDNDSTEFKINPRLIDNPLANQLGDPVVITGNHATTAAVLNGPEYGPVWYEKLKDLPIRTLDSDVLFLPPEL